MQGAQFAELLEHLAAHEVDFIVVDMVDAKERSGRPKDLVALPVLRATLDEHTKRG